MIKIPSFDVIKDKGHKGVKSLDCLISRAALIKQIPTRAGFDIPFVSQASEASVKSDQSTSDISPEECHHRSLGHDRISSGTAASPWRTSAQLLGPSVGHPTLSLR